LFRAALSSPIARRRGAAGARHPVFWRSGAESRRFHGENRRGASARDAAICLAQSCDRSPKALVRYFA
jgi:hypothetical protein